MDMHLSPGQTEFELKDLHSPSYPLMSLVQCAAVMMTDSDNMEPEHS